MAILGTDMVRQVFLSQLSHTDISPPVDEDEFYVFERSAFATDIPTRLPLGQLSDKDLVQDLVQPSTRPIPTAVELSSDKSGIKLSFSTNRMPLMLMLDHPAKT